MAVGSDRLKSEIDLFWTDAGDFRLSKQGDLESTRDHLYRGFLQRLETRMNSARGDWFTQPTVGVGLTDFTGKRNTREVGQAIKQRVASELVRDDFLRPGEFEVQVMPVGVHTVAIALVIRPAGTNQAIVRVYSYKTSDNKLFNRSIN